VIIEALLLNGGVMANEIVVVMAIKVGTDVIVMASMKGVEMEGKLEDEEVAATIVAEATVKIMTTAGILRHGGGKIEIMIMSEGGTTIIISMIMTEVITIFIVSSIATIDADQCHCNHHPSMQVM
jgi:hypothetical protein